MSCAFGTCRAASAPISVNHYPSDTLMFFCSRWHAIAWLIEEAVTCEGGATPKILDFATILDTLNAELAQSLINQCR